MPDTNSAKADLHERLNTELAEEESTEKRKAMRLTVSLFVRFAALLAVTVFVANSPSAPQETPPRTYLGFDRNDYPGDDAMKLLRRDFYFTGYWLGNPPEDTTNSWSGKRERPAPRRLAK